MISGSDALACESGQFSLLEVREDGKSLVEGPFTTEQVEERTLVPVPDSEAGVPFGALNSEWEDFKASMKRTDEIFLLLITKRSEPGSGTDYLESWALVREGCVVQTITTEVGYEGDSAHNYTLNADAGDAGAG
jgi:hypothetical protein